MISGPARCTLLKKYAALCLLLDAACKGQNVDPSQRTEVTAEVRYAASTGHRAPSGIRGTAPAVLWLNPIGKDLPTAVELPPHRFTLTQKDKMFSPHLLIIPLGSLVLFPNQDPFFHNVFSLFDGKRFDLGLYEAGSSRSVAFEREGVSYIFCNIHPEMSAVVIALRTPLHATASASGSFRVPAVPYGDYELHVWVEGEPLSVLNHLTRRVHVDAHDAFLGAIVVPAPVEPSAHANKFGQPYTPATTPY